MLDIYQEIAKITAEGREAALVTVVATSGSTPREVGAKMLVMPDGSIVGSIGGGGVEHQIIKEALEVMRKGIPQRYHYSLVAREGEEPGMVCGGEMDVFVEPLLPPPTLYLFGGGHISLTLAEVGKLLNFKVAVIDDRADYANTQRFPDADLVLTEDFGQAFTKLKIAKTGYIVIVTRNHKTDQQVLELALTAPAKYIGMIGSKSKIKTVFSNLRAKGISKELLDTVHTPIGLEIYAETPEEIAISILAEIIKVKRAPVP